MSDPDFHTAGKLVAEAAAGAAAMYLLHEGRRRPTRPGGNDGGLIPDPQPQNTAEAVGFIAGGLVLRAVIGIFVIIPFLFIWAGIMALPPLALAAPGSSITPFDIGYLAVTGIIGLRILVGIFRAIDGRPTRTAIPTEATVLPARPVPVVAHWEFDYRPSGLIVPGDALQPPRGPDLP